MNDLKCQIKQFRLDHTYPNRRFKYSTYWNARNLFCLIYFRCSIWNGNHIVNETCYCRLPDEIHEELLRWHHCILTILHLPEKQFITSRHQSVFRVQWCQSTHLRYYFINLHFHHNTTRTIYDTNTRPVPFCCRSVFELRETCDTWFKSWP